MAEKSKIKEFPDISNKLTAPNKKSVFERHKAEAEAKKLREEKETAAVYEDFVKSFDDESDPSNERSGSGVRGGALGGSGGGINSGFSKRHFSGTARGRGYSGPGSLGPPPSSLSRRKEFDGSLPAKREGIFAFEDVNTNLSDPKQAFQNSDDEDVDDQRESQDRAVPKPTLRLSSLPPGTSTAAIKAILPSTLTVEGLRILPPSGSGSTDRQASSAVVTLAKDTPALDIDTAVSALQNKYMGRGFNLSISRHLSSSAANLDTSYGFASSSSSLPFNARPVTQPAFSRGSQSGPHRGGFAPPSSYNSVPNQFGRGAPQVQVTVTPPSDLKQLKLIHKTLEALLTHGPEFEALLMSRRAVQLDEKWAWLWDSRSTGGVYYRWRLWDILSGFSQRSRRLRGGGGGPHQLFENGAAWAGPEQKLPFEYTTDLSEIISDSDYDSSEDEDSGDEGRRRYARYHNGAPPPDGAGEGDGQSYLNPMHKAKLTHLLARLPTTHAKLRRGDVARVTAFAIQHAGAGADEVVQMIIANVHHPFAYTAANHSYRPPNPQNPENNNIKHNETPDPVPTDDPTAPPNPNKLESDLTDTTPSKLIALYLISDILSTSSTSGVRHAWRYRALFESALKQHETFSHLGRLEKTHNWGRLRAEKWKRSVQSVLSLWESWCVFPQETQEGFSRVFADPPLTADEEAELARKKAVEEDGDGKSGAGGGNKSKGGKWRSVEDGGRGSSNPAPTTRLTVQQDGDTEMPDVPHPATAPSGDDDLDGEPMSDIDEDIDGVPMSPSTPSSPASDPAHSPKASDPAPVTAVASKSSEPDTVQERRSALAASIAARLGKSGNAPSTPAAGDAAGVGDNGIGKEGARVDGRDAAAGAATGRKRQRPRAEDMFADSDEEKV